MRLLSRFSATPQVALTKLTAHVLAGNRLLDQLISRPSAERDKLLTELIQVERDGDAVVHSIEKIVRSEPFLEFERRDLLFTAVDLDDVLDHVENTALLVHELRLSALPEEIVAAVGHHRRSAELLEVASTSMRSADRMRDCVVEINRIGNQVERLRRKVQLQFLNDPADLMSARRHAAVMDEVAATGRALVRGATSLDLLAAGVR